MNARFLLAGAFAIIAMLALPMATAQTDPVLDLGMPTPASLSLGPNATQAVTWTVTNAGPADGAVALTARAPTGWTVTFRSGDDAFTLARSGSKEIRVTVASGPNAVDGALALSGRLQEAVTNRATTDSSDVALTYVPPAPPPPVIRPPPAPNYALPITLVSLGIVIAAGAGFYVFQARNLRLHVPSSELITVGGADTNYEVKVFNKSKSPRDVELRVLGLPRPWAAAFSFPTVHLVGKEAGRVPLCLRAPIDAEAGTGVQFQIQARPNRYSPWLVASTLRATVADIPRPATTRVNGPKP